MCVAPGTAPAPAGRTDRHRYLFPQVTTATVRPGRARQAAATPSARTMGRTRSACCIKPAGPSAVPRPGRLPDAPGQLRGDRPHGRRCGHPGPLHRPDGHPLPLAREAYTLEEFCLAVAAHGHLQLAACSDVIHHYWSRKAQFRARSRPGWPNMGNIHSARQRWPTSPWSTTSCPGHRPCTAWAKALSLTLPPQERQFARELLYGCYPYANEFDRACASAWWDKALENLNARHGPTDPERLRQCLRHPGCACRWGTTQGHRASPAQVFPRLNGPVPCPLALHRPSA